jgi:hypothetical protein
VGTESSGKIRKVTQCGKITIYGVCVAIEGVAIETPSRYVRTLAISSAILIGS